MISSIVLPLENGVKYEPCLLILRISLSWHAVLGHGLEHKLRILIDEFWQWLMGIKMKQLLPLHEKK